MRTRHMRVGFLGRWGMYACPQCLPSDMFLSEAGPGRFGGTPGIRHRHLPCHTMPCVQYCTRYRRRLEPNYSDGPPFNEKSSSAEERCSVGIRKPVSTAFVRWAGISKGVQNNSVGIDLVEIKLRPFLKDQNHTIPYHTIKRKQSVIYVQGKQDDMALTSPPKSHFWGNLPSLWETKWQ